MSRLYTLSILMACACGARLAEPASTEVVDLEPVGLEVLPEDPFVEPEADPSIDPVARALAAVEAVEPERTLVFELRRGESLAHFARWSDLPVETIAATSGLSLVDDQLAVGTHVTLPWSEGLEERVNRRRDAHHLRRAEGWLSSRGGAVGVTFHTVATGETAWSIARDHADLPVWLVETYNPSVDLEHLRPGQDLMLPLFPDPVAEAPEATTTDLVNPSGE